MERVLISSKISKLNTTESRNKILTEKILVREDKGEEETFKNSLKMRVGKEDQE